MILPYNPPMLIGYISVCYVYHPAHVIQYLLLDQQSCVAEVVSAWLGPFFLPEVARGAHERLGAKGH